MASFSVSPGVSVKEIDLTTVVPAVSTTEGAIAGVFNWGPVDERILVSSENELAKRFGKPNSNNFETFFTAASFLAYGNKLYVARAADAGALNAQANTGAANTIQIKNLDDYATQTLDSDVLYYARYPGALGNSLKVSVCDSASAFRSTTATTVEANTTVTFTTAAGAVVSTITVNNADANDAIANTEATRIVSEITVGDTLLVGSQYIRVDSVSAAAAANGVAVITVNLDSKYTGIANVTSTSGVVRNWEFSSLVDAAPGTSDYVEVRGGAGDELHVVVIDEDGLVSGEKGTVIEVFSAVSRATDAKANEGGSLYYKDVINNESQYLFWGADRTGAASGSAATIAASTNDAPVTLSFVGGVDSQAETALAISELARAYDLFKSAETIDISLLLAGTARGANDTQFANYLIENIAEYRKDCVVFISPARADVVNQSEAVTSVVEFRNNVTSSSYAVLDSGYKYMYDRYNDLYRYVPLNGDIAGLCVRTDEVRDPWFSPAGFNRGQVKNVIKLAYNPDKADRDQLYKNGINPVVSFPGEGTVLYGDKTLLAKPSAFDRINVRRLFIVLEKAISTAAKFSLFEFNDEFTRAQFRNLVEPYLRDTQGRRGIYDFRVICDATNNTAEVIDSNQFIGDIYVKPAKSINFIALNFVAVRTGVDFTEVQNAF